MTDPAMVAKVLVRAAELIEEKGWFQLNCGRGVQPESQCALTAIHNGTLQLGLRPEFGDEAQEIFARHIKCRPYVIDKWNDAPARTEAEVLAALRGAAEGVTR